MRVTSRLAWVRTDPTTDQIDLILGRGPGRGFSSSDAFVRKTNPPVASYRLETIPVGGWTADGTNQAGDSRAAF